MTLSKKDIFDNLKNFDIKNYKITLLLIFVSLGGFIGQITFSVFYSKSDVIYYMAWDSTEPIYMTLVAALGSASIFHFLSNFITLVWVSIGIDYFVSQKKYLYIVIMSIIPTSLLFYAVSLISSNNPNAIGLSGFVSILAGYCLFQIFYNKYMFKHDYFLLLGGSLIIYVLSEIIMFSVGGSLSSFVHSYGFIIGFYFGIIFK